MRAANDGLRFLLELAVLVALGLWGFEATATPLRWVLLIGVPLFVAAVWATWVAAKSSSAVHDPWRLLLEVAVFGAGAAALASSGRPAFAVGLAALAVVHLGLTVVLGQREPARSRAIEPVLVHSQGGEGS